MMNPPEYTQPLKINWAKECFAGAALSIAFTLMAKNSGAEGVSEGDIADQLHQIIVIGGMTMAVVCGLSGFLIMLYNFIEKLGNKPDAVKAPRAGWFGPMQTAKFLKIFLP